MHDQVDQNEFENLYEDQIMQEDYPDYALVWDRCRSPWERNTGERQGESNNLENLWSRQTRLSHGPASFKVNENPL